MANIDKMLHGEAGNSIKYERSLHSSPPSKKQQKGSHSAEVSHSNSGSSSVVQPYLNKKPFVSRVPLKKRLCRESEYDRELDEETTLVARAAKEIGEDKRRSPIKARVRNVHMKAERARALEELVKRRKNNAAKGGSSSRYSPINKRTSTAETSSDEGEDYGSSDGDKDKMSPKSEFATFEEIKEITIQRSTLIKWYMELYFEELMVGCFVRLAIAMPSSRPVYRLCEVRNVHAMHPTRTYTFENKTTYKYLNLIWGKESSAGRWEMTSVSNSPPLKTEFDQWVRQVDLCGGHMPTKDEILQKKAAILKTKSFVYTAAVVKQMLQEKKSAIHRPTNIAAEKENLRRALQMAKQNEDSAEMDRITKKLQELEAERKAENIDPKALKLIEINRRNRAENYINSMRQDAADGTSSRGGEVGYDPFSRRWTRSRNYYAINRSGEETSGISKTNPNANVEMIHTS